MKELQIISGKFWLAGILILLGTLPGIVSAQGLPAELEGSISAIVSDGIGGAYVTIMGISVHVQSDLFGDPNAVPPVPSKVVSPTAELTLNQLLGLDPSGIALPNLPGRTDTGFEGGTGISIGTTTYNGDGTSTFIAGDLFVEPAENVILGAVTYADAGTCTIYLEGQRLDFLQDARVPFGKAINGEGFDVDQCSVVPGNLVAVEGYYGDDGALHIFSFESDDATILGSGGITTVARASCDRGSIEVRGSSTLLNGSVQVYELVDGVITGILGTDSLVYDAVTMTSSYRFRDKSQTENCPDNVRVESWTGPIESGVPTGTVDSHIDSPVDVRSR